MKREIFEEKIINEIGFERGKLAILEDLTRSFRKFNYLIICKYKKKR